MHVGSKDKLARTGGVTVRAATGKRASRVFAGAALLIGVALAGCASDFEKGLVFADSGKYQFHNCQQLTAAEKQTADRERELKGLIDKAEQGAGGVLVSAIAYKTDYIAAGEELRVIHLEMRHKNCAAGGNPR